MDTGEIRFQQLAHQTPRGEVGLQKYYQVSSWKEDTGAKNDGSGSCSNSIVEGIETGCGQDESSHVRNVRQSEYGQRYHSFSDEPVEECEKRVPSAFRTCMPARDWVHSEIGIIEISEVAWVVAFMLFDVRNVHPLERFHEALEVSVQ